VYATVPSITLPVAAAGSAAQGIVEEHGGPYLAGKLSAGVGASRVISRPIRPEVERA